MACAIEAVPRCTEADTDDWGGDDYELPEGAHWDDECPGTPATVAGLTIDEVVTELHRQAHSRVVPLVLCAAPPCCRLGLEQLRALQGRPA